MDHRSAYVVRPRLRLARFRASSPAAALPEIARLAGRTCLAIARIRALRGYGYTHKYLVEDPEMTIARNRSQTRPTTRRLWAVVTARDDRCADVVDEDGRARVRLEGYSTIKLPGGLDADAGRARAEPRRDS
jgi:hypothetical protein